MTRCTIQKQNIEALNVELEVPTRNPNRPSDRLRFEAMAIYVFNIDGVTVEEIAVDPRFAGITLKTLKKWCTEDKWAKQRETVLRTAGEKLKSKLQKELYSRVAQVRIRQLKRTRTLIRDLTEKALGADPKSAEGAAKVVVELMRHELELAKTIAQEMIPVSESSSTIEARNQLTEDEVPEAARLILRSRREQRALRADQPIDMLSAGSTRVVGAGERETPSYRGPDPSREAG